MRRLVRAMMQSQIATISILFAVRIGVCVDAQAMLISSMDNIDTPPNCDGTCDGSWSDWNNWSSCQGGICHFKPGKKSRYRSCHYMHHPPRPRADIRDQAIDAEWRTRCRHQQQNDCADESTCVGSWGEWQTWTQCHKTSRGNATCHKQRRRACMGETERLNGDLCFGGLQADTNATVCAQEFCKFERQTTTPFLKLEPVEGKSVRISNVQSDKEINTNNRHTMVILAVSLGSVVFGIVFIILLINVVRRSSNSSTDGHTERGDQWKRITSTTTSSYVPASEVLSPRIEFSEVRSPSSMTVTSGESSSSSANTNQFPFSRNDSVFLYSAADSNGAALNDFVLPKRRSRLNQENVYWEISDQQSRNALDREDSFISTVPDREEVNNVLYDADA